jgi:hypothetical protein
MTAFTNAEMNLIRKLRQQPAQSVLQNWQPCPTHSVCTPLPLFRVYKIDDAAFEAQWNDYHQPGLKQVFRFEDVTEKRPQEGTRIA